MISNFRSLLLIIIVFFLAGSLLYAQDDFESWKKKDMAKYQEFLEAEDRAFVEFLKKDWEDFQTSLGIKIDPEPKPKQMPTAKEKDKPKPPPMEELDKVDDVPVPEKKPKPKPKPKPVVQKKKDIVPFRFYGSGLEVNYKKDFNLNLGNPLNNDAMSNVWQTMAASEHKPLLDQLGSLKRQMKLNDWGYLVLVHNLAQKLFPNNNDKQNLFMWFVMVKSGYEAKVAYRGNEVFLLIPNINMLYDNSYITLDNKKYFFASFGGPFNLQGKIYTYHGNYEGANKMMSMKLVETPSIKNKYSDKTLRFSFEGKNYNIPVRYDNDVVDFFKDHPQTDYTVYFTAPVSEQASYTLLNALKPHVRGKTELEAVNFVLRFVQTAFEYKTDDQNFGKEKPLMPEETLHYTYSDCEDRSILFSYLVKNLLRMDVIGLDYPGHVATAVRFSDNLSGDTITFNGKKYIVCDPTYINANAGMAMPMYKNVDPEIIKL